MDRVNDEAKGLQDALPLRPDRAGSGDTIIPVLPCDPGLPVLAEAFAHLEQVDAHVPRIINRTFQGVVIRRNVNSRTRG
jgi:hypothetical protein